MGMVPLAFGERGVQVGDGALEAVGDVTGETLIVLGTSMESPL